MNADALLGAMVSATAIAAALGLARWIAAATKREGASEVTTSQLAVTLGRIESQIQALAAGHAESREGRIADRAEIQSLREHGAGRDARLDALEVRITRVDEAHTTARHALRAEIQGWVSTGITDALELLRALIPGVDHASRARRRG